MPSPDAPRNARQCRRRYLPAESTIALDEFTRLVCVLLCKDKTLVGDDEGGRLSCDVVMLAVRTSSRLGVLREVPTDMMNLCSMLQMLVRQINFWLAGWWHLDRCHQYLDMSATVESCRATVPISIPRRNKSLLHYFNTALTTWP